MPQKTDISLLITTYNWPEALDIVLERVQSQTYLPAEVIIADDGSSESTKVIVDKWRDILDIPVLHSWIEDKGFRAAKSRNHGVKVASQPYVVMIDGDILIGKSFIEDHYKNREKGVFLTGGRARLNTKLSEKLLNKSISSFNLFTAGLGRRISTIRIPFYHKMFKGIVDHYKKARSCHLSLWRSDYISVNGFDEQFEGWGMEDSDFVVRLMNSGVKRKNLRHLANCAHIYHDQKMNPRQSENERILDETVKMKKTKATKGINDI